jgi:hypothetical protein
LPDDLVDHVFDGVSSVTEATADGLTAGGSIGNGLLHGSWTHR